ncbi:MAG: diguanylate cyclase [Nitrospirae bacterium]|nr:diguanylate cyclase [Nitrospirota bacterium]MBI4847240.1 diguanylate cyclase [Nitrospirota bacterium]
MKDKGKTKAQLINELALLRQRAARLEAFKARYSRDEKELQEANERLNAILKASPEAIVTLNNDGIVTLWNEAAERTFGWSKSEVIGKFNPIVPENKFEEFVSLRERVLKGESLHNVELRRQKKNGSPVDISISTAPLLNSKNKVTGILAVITDITGRKKMEKKLRALSLKDDMTGLYNRRGFLTFARQQLKMANRRKEGVMLLFADLDGLKMINDGFGHKAGDLILMRTAALLKNVFRESDIIARIGGDEFVVFSIETPGIDIELIKDRFEKHVENYNARRPHIFRLSVSTGIVYYKPGCPYSIEELLTQADKLMYEQKRQKQKS